MVDEGHNVLIHAGQNKKEKGKNKEERAPEH